ncbi:hypothetical protein PMAYCL1PPCAC_29717 [Pristionchus mayeri]|uniref:Transposase Tc5 C-terminal domain-containing protein n=1 Tax=Pristionchus mayeri TaxID=1317129 RepID=A0AAN5DBI7_9BILA|nr:hypothetical protein PMAYCL1PPCAC_29717 [Pristionchus mayeri]
MADGFSLHDIDLQIMALEINSEGNYVTNFQASASFITRFKKFVSRVNHADDEKIKEEAIKFNKEIQGEMMSRPLSLFCNADQSGFLKEMRSKRSLAPIGEKTVVRCVHSKSSLTHSYTVMPLVFADGSMGESLYVVLQEPGGQFPKTKTIFSAPNLVVSAGKSHIMTKAHMKEWVSKCIFTPSITSSDLVILLDSWTSFRDTAAIDSSLPPGKTLHTRQIPPGATGICQPLDVYFFRPFKGLVRRIQSYAFKHHPEFIVYQRDNILILLSLAYRIMCNPFFRPLIQYAWYAAGYLDNPPTARFKTPVEACFPRSVYSKKCSSVGCLLYSFIVCPKCDQNMCFKCFVVGFHAC